jgi:phospholipase/lecithinase/hemolysin
VLRVESLEDRAVPSNVPVGNLVVFGDSLADVGNEAILSGGQIPHHSELYFQGRFSGGPIWVDTLAEYLGEPAVMPSLQPGGKGLDFAYGGATLAYQNTAAPYGSVPRVSQQVATYLNGHTPHANDVFALWAGPNDFFFSLGQQGAPIDPSQPAAALAASLETLIGAGARRFVIANLPPLGETPYFLNLEKAGFLTSQQIHLFDSWSAGFDFYLNADLAQVQKAHPKVTVVSIDVAGLFAQAAQPGNPFGFVNWTDAVGPYDALGHVTAVTATDPQDYLFFDSVHPGTKAHQIIGLRAAAEVYAALGIKEIDVTNTSDAVNPLDGGLSLHEAVNLANAIPGGEKIRFDLGDGRQEIDLGGQELNLTTDVTVQGPGAGRLTISGRGASRVFEVATGVKATLSGLTLRDGSADEGGAVRNAGDLRLLHTVLIDNRARQGGAVYNSGVLHVEESELSFNIVAGGDIGAGGALANSGKGASAYLTETLVSDNLVEGGAHALGGGIANLDEAILRVSDSLLLGNGVLAGDGGDGLGGGIYNGPGSALELRDSLLLSNYARAGESGRGLGGGLYLSRGGASTLHGALIFGNFASTDGWDVYAES